MSRVPVSVGSIHITSSEPATDPAIDPAYLMHAADIEVLTKGMEMMTKMASTSPLREMIKRRYYPKEGMDMGDKQSTEEYLWKHCFTGYHPIGSVSMGSRGMGAVDDRLRFWGTRGLRVVNAGVMPLHVSGNIVATVYVIAEKGSDLIMEDWGL